MKKFKDLPYVMKRFDFSGAGEHYHVLREEDVGSVENLVRAYLI